MSRKLAVACLTIAVATMMISARTALCGIIISAEAAGVQITQVSGATTNDFNSLPLGYQTDVVFSFGSIVGTYDKLYITVPDIYGGAYGTQYPTSQVAYSTDPYALSLSQPVNYFGMYWSAGDCCNYLTFYNGVTQVGSFTTATALALLPSAYYGNPSAGWVGSDPTEPFAYLNFSGTDGTTFDKIVLSVNGAGTGFESDNHAIAQITVPPSGDIDLTPVPEPTSLLLLGTGLGALALAAWRRRK